MRRSIKSGLAGITALALGAGGVLLAAGPASAASDDVLTPQWEWESVEDDALYISDAAAFYTNFRGTGVDIEGWTDDAFDGFLDGFGIVDPDGVGVSVLLTPQSADYQDYGLTTIVATGTATVDDGDGGEIDIDITVTLRIQNDTAKWDFTFDADGADLTGYTAVVDGELGSDSDTEYFEAGDNSFVSVESSGGDPVIAYNVSPGVLVDGNEDELTFDLGIDAATIAIALIDYDPCSQQVAIDRAIGAAPGLIGNFGVTIPPALSTTCLTPSTPAKLDRGTATSQTLTLTASEQLNQWFGEGDAFPYGEDFRIAVIDGLPEGVSITAVTNPETGEVTLQVTGTPTKAGSYTTRLVGYFFEEGDDEDDAANQYPLLFDLRFEVAGPQLARTGVAQSPVLWIGGGVILLLGAGLVIFRVTHRTR